MISGLSFIAIDEGRQRLSLFDSDRPGPLWSLDLAALPLARDLQRLDDDRVLVGYDRGFFILEIAKGTVLSVVDRWRRVTGARRGKDGTVLVTGLGLEGEGGVQVLRVDFKGGLLGAARREGDYVRLMRPTARGTYLLASDDHILETDENLVALRRLEAPGFRHAWLALERPGGSILVSGGYGAFMARFDAEGRLLSTFGRKGEVPEAVSPNFYATVQALEGERILVANWQGHGPGKGAKGRQLLEFDAEGRYVDSWSDKENISSLQGLLVL